MISIYLLKQYTIIQYKSITTSKMEQTNDNIDSANIASIAKPWTPLERDDWIAHALSSKEEREVRNGFMFNTMQKQGDAVNDTEDPKRTFVTSCLAKSLYANHPLLKRLSLCFYKSLMFKIEQNSFLKLMLYKHNFIVVVKGSNAYKMLLRHVPHEIEHSDLDMIIFINPLLDEQLFEQIKSSLVILVSQVMSRYKKDLDATLFNPEDRLEECILRQDFVKQFKELYMTALKDFVDTENGFILSPFESTVTRNKCSKKSFVILNSEVQDDHVVRVEVPHLQRCEFIPLKRTPLVLSHNKTIKFDRDVEGVYKADFDLIRLRLNNLYMFATEEETVDIDEDTRSELSVSTEKSSNEKNKQKYKVVPADFIDVSIPSKYDAELIDFWTTGGARRCYEIYDKFVGSSIMIPNVNECIRDLTNILDVYTNSQMKTEKRQKRLALFKQLVETRKAWKAEEDAKSLSTNA